MDIEIVNDWQIVDTKIEGENSDDDLKLQK